MIGGVSLIHECAKICAKDGANPLKLCGGITYCDNGDCYVHHKNVSLDMGTVAAPGCELYERF